MESSQLLLTRLKETIGRIQEIETIELAENAAVEGRTGNYTVDLYWEFRFMDGVLYKLVIDLKNVENNLKKNDLFQFANMIQDITGMVKGVIFTQPVYDKMMQDIAKDVGIVLYEMPEINETSKTEVGVSDMKLDLDFDWINAEKAKKGLSEEKLEFHGEPRYMYIYDEAGTCIDSVEGVIRDYLKKYQDKPQEESVAIEHKFAEPAFLDTGNAMIPRIKLNGINFAVAFRTVNPWSCEEIIDKLVNKAIGAN